jgi:alkylhydroperoxidase family enzyme
VDRPRIALVRRHLVRLMPDLSGIETYRPRLGEAIGSYRELLSSLVDPTLVELCRLRIAQVVRGSDEAPADPALARQVGISEAQLADLASWYTSEHFDATQRACLQLAEYFCYSAQSVTDAHVAEVRTHLSAEQVLGLTNAIWVEDSAERLSNFLASLDAPQEAPA